MMNFFKGLFGGGGSSAPKQTGLNVNKGLEQLEEKADMMKKRIAHLQKQMDEQEKIVRDNANTNKNIALTALRKKKTLEKNIQQAQNMLRNIEQQMDMLENASANAAVLKTMSQTAKIVKHEQDNLDINEVEDIVDEMRERKEISDEIANILGQNMDKETDDDELLKELEGVKQEELDNKLRLPTVPTTKLPAQPEATTSTTTTSKKDEEELDELKKWASAAQ